MPEADVRDHQRVLPGQGIIDLNSFRDALDTAGYARFISPEIRGYRSHAGDVTAARAALDAVHTSLNHTAE
jgi:sugar phosphate isomerase/epimerase